jgi:hypothetical protein
MVSLRATRVYLGPFLLIEIFSHQFSIFFHAKLTLELCHEANSDGGTEEQPTNPVTHAV